MRRLTLSLLAAVFLVACNRTPTAPTGVPLSASRGEHGSAPALEWSQGTNTNLSTYDFGAVDPASPSSVTFTLTNTGGRSSGTVTVSLSTSSVYSIAVDHCTDNALGPNDSCTVTVEFAPTSGDTFTATLTANAEHGSASLDLTGEVAAWTLHLSPNTSATEQDGGWTSYTYGLYSPPGFTQSQTFTVTNVGNTTSPALVVGCDGGSSSICRSGDWGSISHDYCTGSTLAPNGTCTFEVDATLPSTCYTGDYSVTSVLVGDTYNDLTSGSLLLKLHTGCYLTIP